MRDLRFVVLPLVIIAVPTPAFAQPAAADPAAVEFFEKKVRPVLVEHCHQCHSATAKKLRGGLLLDSRAGLLKGGDNGPAARPGNPEKSRLVEAISYKNVDLQMPPKGKLPDAVIADLTAWVKAGAVWPNEQATAATARNGFDLQQRKKNHWAWQPLHVARPPSVHDQSWVRTPADAFLLARLEAKGLHPSEAADRRTLLRRVTFDLVGLPPSPEEMDAFLADDSPDAFARVVDRLLGSPRFGERWARHWLDLVRYAESRGHELDYTIPNAHQYRDYVIRALNADVPYDQFVTEHIAGDLLERPRTHPKEGFNESVLGTGFWFLGEEVHSPVDTRQDEADRFDNRIDVMTKTFLGLTVSCARCHDHKFDAISSKDYYALFGFLESSSYRLVRFDTLEQDRRLAGELAKLRERNGAALRQAIASAIRPTAERSSDYLLAAREALLAGPDGGTSATQTFAAKYRRRSAAIAEARRLRPELLEAWMAHLVSCAADDPFHSWARIALEAETRDPRRLADKAKSARAALDEEKRASQASIERAEVVVDYGKLPADRWMPDDSGFGLGPRRPGELQVSGDEKQPRVHLTERGAAVYDRAWDGRRFAAGAENDPSAVGKMLRAGRTIRTPSFSLTTGQLFYLVRGVGQAYAAVGQHALINGPLHARLVAAIDTQGKYRWVRHDLTAYIGQSTHVEFTALSGHDFEVAAVVQAERPPTVAPNRVLARLLEGGGTDTLHTLAAGYQRALLDACDRLSADRLADGSDAADLAQLLNWALAHPTLFGEAEFEPLTEAVRRHVDQEKSLLGRGRRESRLALAMLDGNGMDERVFVRGSPKALGEPAPRRFLEALAGPKSLPVQRGSGRLELARQMTDPSLDPLLPRVMINRVWHHLFGRGIVASVDNFGVLGEAPTHPELLDYLADGFVADGWSVKKLIRRLVLSSAYQMSSASPLTLPSPPSRGGEGRVRGDAEQADPQNLLLHRMRVRRLEGEAIRDAMLAVSGRLDAKMYGPAVPVYLTPFLDGRGRPTSGPLDGDGRRSVYIAVRRNFLSPLLLTFDTPIPFSTVGRRTVSNVPAQALILMNDPFVHQQAETWARRVLTSPGTAEERIASMYASAFGRSPTDSERAACVQFVEEQARLHDVGPNDVLPWKDLAHALFNVKEFIYLN